MLRQPAKALESDDVRRLLEHVRHHRHPLRDRVIVLLSFKSGLDDLDDTAIADRLSISRNTVRNHVASIYAKIGTSRRSGAVVWGRERGMGLKRDLELGYDVLADNLRLRRPGERMTALIAAIGALMTGHGSLAFMRSQQPCGGRRAPPVAQSRFQTAQGPMRRSHRRGGQPSKRR